MGTKVGYIVQLQDKFSRAATKISRKMVGIDKGADKTAKTINKKLAPAFGNLQKKAVGALGAITAAFSAREFLTRGAAFQDAIADLSSITGSAGKELQFLSDESLRLAKSASIAQVEVANAFTQIASAKSELLKDPKGLSIVTEQALLLANAAGISVPDAVRASVGALNQFNLGADQAARFINVLAAGAKVGASQVGETAEAMKNAGSVAAQFGVTFEQTNAILQVLAKNEIKGAEAGTALRGTLSKLEKFMGGKFAPSKVGIIQSFEAIGKLGLSNTQVIKDFGEENLRSILILRKNTPLIKQWTRELTGTNTAQEQADKRLSTFNAKMRKVGVTINDAIIKTFNRLAPVLTSMAVDFGAFLEGIKPERLQAFGDGLGVIANAAILIGQTFGVILDRLARIGSGIGLISAGFATGSFAEVLPELRSLSGVVAPPLTNNKSQSDVNVNLRAPAGVIESVKSRTTGKSTGLNLGVNMETAE